MTFNIGENFVKAFSSSLSYRPIKLVRLSQASFFQASLKFVDKARQGANPQSVTHKILHTGSASLTRNYQGYLKKLPWANSLAYLPRTSVPKKEIYVIYAILRVLHLKVPTLVGSSLTHYYQGSLKKLSMGKQSSLFAPSISAEERII